MRILLLQVPLGPNSEVGPVFPLGLLHVADASVSAGHMVTLLDLNLHVDWATPLSLSLRSSSPEVVGLSLRNIDNVDRLHFRYFYPMLKDVLALVRRERPGAVIVLGGPGFSLFPKEIMSRHREIDFGVQGDGDLAFIELLERLDEPDSVAGVWHRHAGHAISNGARRVSLDSRGPIDRELINPRQYPAALAVGIQASRGCWLRCSYCSYPILNGRRVSHRSVDSTIAEIEQLLALGVTEFTFTDSVFDLDSEHALLLCERMAELSPGTRWTAWFDVAKCSQAMVDAARMAGCYRLAFSPDGVTNRTLKSLGKAGSVDDVRRLLRLARKNPDLKFRLSVIGSAPNESTIDVLRLIGFLLYTNLFFSNLKCMVSWMRILPDTPIYRVARQQGVIQANTELLPEDGQEVLARLFYVNPATAWLDPLVMTTARVAAAAHGIRGKVVSLLRMRRTSHWTDWWPT